MPALRRPTSSSDHRTLRQQSLDDLFKRNVQSSATSHDSAAPSLSDPHHGVPTKHRFLPFSHVAATSLGTPTWLRYRTDTWDTMSNLQQRCTAQPIKMESVITTSEMEQRRRSMQQSIHFQTAASDRHLTANPILTSRRIWSARGSPIHRIVPEPSASQLNGQGRPDDALILVSRDPMKFELYRVADIVQARSHSASPDAVCIADPCLSFDVVSNRPMASSITAVDWISSADSGLLGVTVTAMYQPTVDVYDLEVVDEESPEPTLRWALSNQSEMSSSSMWGDDSTGVYGEAIVGFPDRQGMSQVQLVGTSGSDVRVCDRRNRHASVVCSVAARSHRPQTMVSDKRSVSAQFNTVNSFGSSSVGGGGGSICSLQTMTPRQGSSPYLLGGSTTGSVHLWDVRRGNTPVCSLSVVEGCPVSALHRTDHSATAGHTTWTCQTPRSLIGLSLSYHSLLQRVDEIQTTQQQKSAAKSTTTMASHQRVQPFSLAGNRQSHLPDHLQQSHQQKGQSEQETSSTPILQTVCSTLTRFPDPLRGALQRITGRDASLPSFEGRSQNHLFRFASRWRSIACPIPTMTSEVSRAMFVPLGVDEQLREGSFDAPSLAFVDIVPFCRLEEDSSRARGRVVGGAADERDRDPRRRQSSGSFQWASDWSDRMMENKQNDGDELSLPYLRTQTFHTNPAVAITSVAYLSPLGGILLLGSTEGGLYLI